MSSQSPQRMRKVQATHQGQPTREMSPSPTIRDRQRTIKASSLSHMPSVAQVYSNMNSQTQPQSPQANGNGSNIPRRSPPASQVPQPGSKIPSPRDDDHMTPPPPPIHTHSGSNIHSNILPPPQPHHSMSQPNIHSHFTPLGNPRPIRVQSQHLLQSFHNADENWQMTDELLADIERADLQLQQGQHSNPPGTFGVAYAGGMITGSKMNTSFIAGSPPRDSAIDSRVKVNERPVQKDTDINHATSGINGRRQREQQAARESPNNRDRPTHSPEQDHFHSPQSIVDHNPSYNQYKRETYPPTQRISTPPIMRRPTNASFTEPPPARATPPGASKLSSHSPPGQAMNTRPPDRSLPVQEEPEDDMVTSKNGLHDRDRDSWRSDDGMHHDDLHDEEDDEQRMGSPTPSSDAHPEGHAPPRYDSGRNSAGRDPRAGQSEDDDQTLIDTPPQRLRDREEEEESFTPRSPSAPLPEDSRFYNLTNTQTVRAKMGRNSSTDQLNLRNFESAALEQNAKMKNGTNESNQGRQNVVEQTRRSIQSPPQQHQQPPQQQQHLQQEYSQQQQSHPQHPQLQHSQLHQSQLHQSQPQHPQQQHLHQLHLQQQHLQQQHAQQQIYAPQYQNGVHLSEQQGSDGGFYIAPDDETQSVTDDPALAAYMYYYQSARPNAPIPPTPQSHTAAPSPSPMMSDAGMKVLPPMTPIQPVGSPYPFPFGHVRRTNNFASRPNIMTPASNYDQNNPAVIQEQIARQLEAYARNNHVALSDSTFSPSATPFQGPGYNPWAVLHNRAYGGQLNASMSLQSSPSHEPIQLPYPTPRGRVVKKRETQTNLRRNGSSRKPPPRVESTQPRETSPELSTSGEETAGEDQQPQHHYGPQEMPTYVNGISHDDGDWIDEDDDGDEDDLLDLEYHPTFVTNIEKRRRRWETRWETLVHAFQALDRQTDATLILLASPSHSTKLHSLTSRSIRRDQSPAKTQAMSTMRSSFRQLSSRRKSSRTQKVSLAEMLSSGSSIDGSPVSHGAREEELRRALGGALGSLGALGSIYEQREARWREEMRKITEEREKVEFLLKQALGPSTGAAVGSAL